MLSHSHGVSAACGGSVPAQFVSYKRPSLVLAGVGSVFMWLVGHDDGDDDGGDDDDDGDGGGDDDDDDDGDDDGDLGNWGEWWLMIDDGFMVNWLLKEPRSIRRERRRVALHYDCGYVHPTVPCSSLQT